MRTIVAAVVVLCACGKGSGSGSGSAVTTAGRDPDGGGGSGGSGSGSGAKLRLITEAEIAQHKDALLKRFADAAKHPCPRPVLRGAAVPGAAAADQIAAFEAHGTLAACTAKTTELAKAGTIKQMIDKLEPEVIAIERTCGADVETAVARAVAHEDACAPYQVGVRAEPKSFMSSLQIAQLVALHAMKLAQDDPAEAIAVALDGVRLFQDFGRGHVSLIDQMIAIAGMAIVLDRVEIIAGQAKLLPPRIAELAKAVDVLIASEPPFNATLQGERDAMELTTGLAPLEPANWVPPGGGWPGGDPPERVPTDDSDPRFDPRDGWAVMLYAGEAAAAVTTAACPPGPYKACHDGIVKVETIHASKTDTGNLGALRDQLYQAALAGAGKEEIRTRLRDQLAEILTSKLLAGLDESKYIGKRAFATHRLAALRLDLEIKRAGNCPSLPALEAAPFGALRQPAILGDKLQVLPARGGGLDVTVPAWIGDKPPWHIACGR